MVPDILSTSIFIPQLRNTGGKIFATKLLQKIFQKKTLVKWK